MCSVAGHIQAAELLKLPLTNGHVWDVIEPHTPPHIKMGLQSPKGRILVHSSQTTRVQSYAFANNGHP